MRLRKPGLEPLSNSRMQLIQGPSGHKPSVSAATRREKRSYEEIATRSPIAFAKWLIMEARSTRKRRAEDAENGRET